MSEITGVSEDMLKVSEARVKRVAVANVPKKAPVKKKADAEAEEE